MTATPTLSLYLTLTRVSENSLVSCSPDSRGSSQTCFKNAALRNQDAKEHKTPQSTSLHLRNGSTSKGPETCVKRFAFHSWKNQGHSLWVPTVLHGVGWGSPQSMHVVWHGPSSGPGRPWSGPSMSVYKWLSSVCRNQWVRPLLLDVYCLRLLILGSRGD